MITASIVVYHTAAHELLRVINCAVRSAIEILYIIDNSSNDSLRELKDVSEKIVYIHSENLGLVTGCFATKIVQQSSYGWMEVS